MKSIELMNLFNLIHFRNKISITEINECVLKSRNSNTISSNRFDVNTIKRIRDEIFCNDSFINQVIGKRIDFSSSSHEVYKQYLRSVVGNSHSLPITMCAFCPFYMKEIKMLGVGDCMLYSFNVDGQTSIKMVVVYLNYLIDLLENN